jgi:putative ABC transport system substrate-binding protein
LQAAARTRGLPLHVLRASTEPEFDAVFESIARPRAAGLVISSDSFFYSRSNQLASLASRHSVPTIFPFREFVAAGGLMSYGGSLTESFRWVGVYAGRILKGEKLADRSARSASHEDRAVHQSQHRPEAWSPSDADTAYPRR